VKGRGVSVEAEDSILRMEMIDAMYLKTGLPLRATIKALGGGIGRSIDYV
jgi:hypothetical protein